MFKKIFDNIKKHWMIACLSFVGVVLIGSGIYYFVNGGSKGLNNKKVEQTQINREWKENKSVNQGNSKTNIYPTTVVQQAVKKKFGNNFDYVNNFNKINGFIKRKFNNNTALVFANNTEITNDMTGKEKNSAVGNIKQLTTDMYGGLTSKDINVDLASGSCSSTSASVELDDNTYCMQTPKTVRTNNGALVGVPIINATKNKDYPFYQLTILYSPNSQGDITFKEFLESAKNIKISCGNKQLNPAFYALENTDDYSGSNRLEEIKDHLKSGNYQPILIHFNATNSNQKNNLSMFTYEKNSDKKIIGNDFYSLTYEIPDTLVDKGGESGVQIEIENARFTLFPTNKQNYKWGSYKIIN